MEQWEYYVAQVELTEIEGRYDWMSSIGRETIVGLSPLLKRFGLAGWELVALLPLRQTTLAGNAGITQVEILTAAFKRRLVASGDATAASRQPSEGSTGTTDPDAERHDLLAPGEAPEP